MVSALRVKVCALQQLPQMTGQVFSFGEEEVAAFRLSNGNVRAIENKSPHPKGGKLADGLVSGEYVFCPIHDWKISLIDGQVQAPDQGSVKNYPVEVVDGEVFISL